MSTPDTLLRIEFAKSEVSMTDDPLNFIAGEMRSIIEKGVPVDVALVLSAAQKIVVTITAE